MGLRVASQVRGEGGGGEKGQMAQKKGPLKNKAWGSAGEAASECNGRNRQKRAGERGGRGWRQHDKCGNVDNKNRKAKISRGVETAGKGERVVGQREDSAGNNRAAGTWRGGAGAAGLGWGQHQEVGGWRW